jgi:4-hydroxy-4-methyl-2-oxoglutarate aldolase
MVGERITSALVADALDAVGIGGRCLGPEIRMLCGEALLARALTASTARTSGQPDGDDDYAGLKALLHGIRRGDLVVLATDRSDEYATWGELVSMAAVRAGGVGFLSDGLVRDLDGIERLPFTVFARGTRPVDIGGRADVVGLGDPVVIDGVSISTGDLVAADRDGVAVVPGAVAEIVLERARGKALDERHFHEALAEGAPIWEAFERFHVL